MLVIESLYLQEELGVLTLSSGSTSSRAFWLLDDRNEIGERPALFGDPCERGMGALSTHRSSHDHGRTARREMVPHG
jgi:hypothetical protein